MDFNTFLLGLLVCFLLSFLLGLERQIRRRFIGLRTMILVAIGSYMFVSFSFLVTGYQIDVSRIASQVVAGIGFLGAGVIIKDNEKNKVKGLTTAATLWCDAGVGILCAGGFVKEAFVVSLLILFANIILRYVNIFINKMVENRNINETFRIILSLSKKDDSYLIMDYISCYINKFDDMEAINYKVDDEKIEFEIVIKKQDDKKIDKFINKLVSDFKLSTYEYKKIDENRLEDEL